MTDQAMGAPVVGAAPAPGGWRGLRIELVVGPVAHGGHCVARHEGRVVFVRHALPGERVVAEVTEDRGGSFCRADAVEVLVPATGRVAAPCAYAGPGRCGGCDWQHATPATQRELKAAVVREQLVRLGGLPATRAGELVGDAAEELPGGPVGWRTRIAYAVDRHGRVGLRRHRSHRIVPVEACPLGTAEVTATRVTGRRWPGVDGVDVVASSAGDRVVIVTESAAVRDGTAGSPDRGRTATRDVGAAGVPADVRVVGTDVAAPRVRERVAGTAYRVRASGFWQVHPATAGTLVGAVLDALAPLPGERALDLYAGAGLFAAPLAAAVGPAGSVTCVESDRAACTDARLNLRGAPWARVVQDRVESALTAGDGVAAAGGADVVVLDPPRSGAGAAVVRAIAGLGPRAVAYVACDPAALARDVRTFAEAGYALSALRVLDAFPMTHHVECVAILTRAPAPDPQRPSG